MKSGQKIKEKIVTVVTWLGIAVISTGISFVFIIGFKELFGF